MDYSWRSCIQRKWRSSVSFLFIGQVAICTALTSTCASAPVCGLKVMVVGDGQHTCSTSSLTCQQGNLVWNCNTHRRLWKQPQNRHPVGYCASMWLCRGKIWKQILRWGFLRRAQQRDTADRLLVFNVCSLLFHVRCLVREQRPGQISPIIVQLFREMLEMQADKENSFVFSATAWKSIREISTSLSEIFTYIHITSVSHVLWEFTSHFSSEVKSNYADMRLQVSLNICLLLPIETFTLKAWEPSVYVYCTSKMY